MPNATFQNGLTLKSFLITLCLIPINIFWIVQLEVIRYTFPTLVHPLSNVVFILFWLLLIGCSLKKISPKLGISSPELLTIYVMLGIVSSLGSADMMQILITILGHPFRFATPENQWRELFWKELPPWLTVQDEKALVPYYEGGSSFYIKRHLYAWLRPALAYISFIFVLMSVMLCINTLLRIQWTERERLTYPIIQLPLEMTDTRSRFFKNKLMWFGFSIAALISIVNLLNSIYPAVPYIPVKRQNLHQYFTGHPWEAMGYFRVSFYPFVIGIGFLIPLDLLFSCWMFYGVYKIELMLGNIMGWRNLPRFPYFNEQGFGVYVGLLGFALWTGRIHFKGLVRHLLRSSSLDDSREPMPYRLAVAGILAGLVLLTIFSYRAGMSLWVIPIFFGIYFLLAIMIGRLRAELGFLVHDLHYIDPHSMIIAGFGTRRLGAGTLTVFSIYKFFNRAYRAHPMPVQLEALKIAERRNINPRHIAAAILLATLIGSVSVFWVLLDNYYRHGAETGYYGPFAVGFARIIYSQLENWLNYPQETDFPAIAFMGGGLIFTALLMFLRTRFLWWPLHPLGYAMANSWGMFNLWACLFVAWGLKAIILRHGGLKAYRQAIPFFLGLALGDYILGSLWSIISIVTNTTLYQFFP
ncbi:hypothetical protein C6502_19795 [Candidatus Poribacteria bacterium]|nr:MAG: hypothetical protein C6502_19795 [Candidatus Poribacteria bacterium]